MTSPFFGVADHRVEPLIEKIYVFSHPQFFLYIYIILTFAFNAFLTRRRF